MKSRIGRSFLTLLGILLLAGIAYGLYVLFLQDQEGTSSRLDYSLVRPRRGPINATIDSSGSIKAAEVVNLDFEVNGTIAEILVDVGDRVQKGDALARLESSELVLGVSRAEASLEQAIANYQQIVAAPDPAQIRENQALLSQAQARLNQVQGEVTSADIAAAQAQLEQAQETVAQLEAGAKDVDIRASRANLERVQSTLASQQTSLSAAKTSAHLQMVQAANALRDRQADYSRIYWENRNIEQDWGRVNLDLPQNSKEREEAALRAVQNAETALEQARVSYEEARQQEITGLQSAEADVRNAQANLDKLLQGADADELATARAQVADARARLVKLTGEQRAASLEDATAGVASAQARLDYVLAPPRDADIAAAQAQIKQAEVSLTEAQNMLDKTTLKAPITGTVAEVNLQIGEQKSSVATRPAIVLADLSRFYVFVTVDEIDVAQLALQQVATLTFDALPEVEIKGVVDTMSPLASEESTVASYVVRIETPNTDERIRSGMSVNADIIVAQKTDALLVPRRAVYAEQGKRYVDILTNQALCDTDVASWPLEPELEAAEVTTGLSNETAIEILSANITTDTCLYVEGVDARMNPLTGPPPGSSERRRRE